MINQLKQYFENASPKQIKSDWEKSKEFDKNGITVLEYFDSLNEIQKALLILNLSFSKQQIEIFQNIPFGIENAISCNELSKITGFETKNISSQLKVIIEKYPKIKIIAENNKNKYYHES